MLDWTRYLESIRSTYDKWWRVYTFTDVVGEVPQDDRASEVPLLDLGLMVETRAPSEKRIPDGERFEENKKKIERLGVLEGLQKYASEHVLLVGRPGSGKSTALLRMLLEEVEGVKCSDGPLAPNTGGTGEGLNSPLLETSRNSSFESRSPKLGGRGASSSGQTSEISQTKEDLKIPTLVELRYWQTSTLELIRRFLLRHGAMLGVDEIEQGLVEGRFLLLIDGINELPSEEARRNVKAFRQDYPRTPMVFTTREMGLGGDLEITRRLEMQPLSKAQMQQFVLRYLPERGEEMWGQMGDRLRQLGETPLLLWMLCSMFGQLGDIPNSLGLVFRRFTALYGEKLKEDVTAESRQWWPVMLRQLAWVMTEGDEPTEIWVAIPRGRAEAALVACLRDKVAYPEARAKEWLEELLQHQLIQLRADEQIEFRHQLIQEYYAAEGLLERVPEMTDEVLQRRYLDYLKWTEPVALMLELVADEALAMRVVERTLEVDLRLGARLAGASSQFQDKTISLVSGLDVSNLIRFLLLAINRFEFAVDQLLTTLAHENLSVRRRIDHVLELVNFGEGIRVLLNALANIKIESLDVRCSIENALKAIAKRQEVYGISESFDKRCHAFSRRYGIVNPPKWTDSQHAIDTLLIALKDKRFYIRRRAVWALGRIKSRRAVDGLLAALSDEDPYIVRDAVFVLEAIASPNSLSGLNELLLETNRIDLLDTIAKVQEKCRFYRYYSENECQSHDRPMTNQFDVFLAHNSNDKPLIRQLRDHLQAEGIQTWLDEDNILPGRQFQDEVQNAIRQIKSAAICIGQSGLGRWQDLELKAFISECVERGVPVIPVLLPGVSAIPTSLPFLKQFQGVTFQSSIDEAAVLNKLIQGITQNPQ
ncbi:MAG: TIR domain-containing protein [Cyanobacteria bacterium P01_A01_bin.135]